MATAEMRSNFPEQIEECRMNIRDNFKRSHEALQERENILLSRLDEIEIKYNNETKEMKRLVEALARNRSFTSDNLRENKLKETYEQICSAIDSKISHFQRRQTQALSFRVGHSIRDWYVQLGSIKLNGLRLS